MKNFLVLVFFILISLESFGQAPEAQPPAEAPAEAPAEGTEVGTVSPDPTKLKKPKSRQKTKTNQGPQDSSSFIGDPDNLDPLKANDDNLREDDEPVLEDIKDVLSSKKKKKSEKPADTSAEAPAPTPSDTSVTATPAPEVPAPAPVPEPVATVVPDDPDLALEKKFHDIYQTYNKNPTPDDIWAEATGKQTARLYEVQKGDTLWSISKILFGDPNFWPKLWAINKQGILNPHFINPKMKIFFYEGTEEDAPTLTVGEKEPVEAPKAEPPVEAPSADPTAPVVAGAPAPPPSDKPQLATTEMAVSEAGKVPRTKYKPVRPVPNSLPEGRNLLYYEGKKNLMSAIKVDLGTVPKSEFFYVNDIIITDVDVQSEIVLKIEEIQKLRCSPGRLLKEIEYSGSLVEQYDIYEKLDGLPTSTGFKYTYRLTGRAKSYKDKYLTVTECKSFISTDLIIVPRDQMKELATQKVSDVEEPRLIGAPDNETQKFYAVLNYAFVDFGEKKYDIGQNFKLISDVTDQVNGEFKVIEKFGSYAVVVMTDVQDQVSIGDKVDLQ